MIVRFKLDLDNLPRLTDAEAARLDAMTDDEIQAAALSDPDNPPMTDEDLGRIKEIGRVRRAREKSGLSQSQFAETFRISLGRLRDLEQGRTRPDSAMLAYLTVIEREPEAVRRALEPAG